VINVDSAFLPNVDSAISPGLLLITNSAFLPNVDSAISPGLLLNTDSAFLPNVDSAISPGLLLNTDKHVSNVDRAILPEILSADNNVNTFNASSISAKQTSIDHSYQDIAKSHLKFVSLNACGIKSKLLSYDFENFIKKYDIVCITETKLCDSDSLELDGFSVFMKNRSKAKRNSGGVAVLVRKDLTNYVEILDSQSDFNMWFKISNELLGYDLLCCNTYIPPENSAYSSIDLFDTLENEYIALHNNDELVCFFGDFNGRSKDLTDLCSLDTELLDSLDVIDDYLKAKIGEENILDELGFSLNRVSQDPKCNNYGLRLLEMCKTIGVCIINGRIGSDKGIGHFTCDGASVVDYILSSPKLFPAIADFEVLDFDCNYSDKHCPLFLALKMVDPTLYLHGSKQSANRDVNIVENAKAKPKWCSDKKEELRNNLNDEKLAQFLELVQSADGRAMNQTDIDEIVNSIGVVFNESASDTGIMYKNHHREFNRKSGAKPWFNKECEDRRKEYLHVKNQFAISKTLVLRQGMRNLNKEYKKTPRKAYNDYYAELNKKLRNLKRTNPKVFWSILNKGSKLREEVPVDTDDFFRHFRDLNRANIDEDAETNVLESGSVGYNTELNAPITSGEISNCIKKLKNNKAHGTDMVLNEYLKNTDDKMLPIYNLMFNLVLNTGHIPTSWLTGIIRPLYKKKGDKTDVNNYRGLTLLSCFGKLFTSVLNNRLTSFLECHNAIGTEQAGFRKGYSTLEHIFTMRCLLDLYLEKKKRLYCCFVDYKKAFDTIDRITLWHKLISHNINGKFFKVIFNLYHGAKSCVSLGKNAPMSIFFSCLVGVRQGENLSPVLFAIYLNDLEQFLSKKYNGLPLLKNTVSESLEDDDVTVYLNLFILLYADDTILLSENEVELQNALDGMLEYCKLNKLHINTSKTKVMIFSRGKVRNFPEFKYGDERVEVVDKYTYLGNCLNYNGSLIPNLKALSLLANKAMFAVLNKGKNLDVDTLLHLFDSMVMPILMYGCETWGYCNIDIIERVHLRFCKLLLKLNKSTPNVMVYGELGRHPLSLNIKVRMVSFWHKLVSDKSDKFSTTLYKLMYNYIVTIAMLANG
jgi:hypothetical protein